MAWIALALLVFLFMLAPLVGTFVMPWSPWWYVGAQANPAGVVPPAAMLAPQGPLASDSSSLMRAVQKWLAGPTRYVFGGCSFTGVDCSCMVQIVFRELGYSLPRTAQQQWNATARVSSPEPGDLVFFEKTYSSPDRITHVGIVVADGWMVSAAEPSVGRQLYASGWWRSRLAGFGRVR